MRCSARIPLSPQQEWIWESMRFMHPDAPGSTRTNVCLAFTVTGPLDVARLTRSLAGVRQRHEALRTALSHIGDAPFQEIQEAEDPHELPFQLIDISSSPPAGRRELCVLVANAEDQRVFDFVEGPLWQVTLVRCSPEEHVLILSASHLVVDAPSAEVVVRHLAAVYSGTLLPERQQQYQDFARRAGEMPADGEKRTAYWTHAFTPVPPPLGIPTDYPAAPPPAFLRRTIAFTSDAAPAALAELRGRTGVTPYLIHVTAYVAALASLSRARRIVVGSSLTRMELKPGLDVVGHFADLALLPIQVSPEHTFEQLLEHVRDTTLDVYDHQLPYLRIAEAIDPDFQDRRPWPARALYHVWIRGSVLTADPSSPESFGSAEIRAFDFAREDCYTIDLDADRYAHVYGQHVVPSLYVGPTGLEGAMSYNRAVFTPQSVRTIVDRHRDALTLLLTRPHARIGEMRNDSGR
ncbi:condensation domain-containing protein [Streptomyces sp. NPDC048430]|uniref:condensation domain-containing protein n=1 Tax=Streptomyces sp. NPDC048430 TaxID=3155388 RepID=UPI003444764B